MGMECLIMLRFLIGFIISFFVTYNLVPLFCDIAIKYGIIDTPDGIIKKHKRPTPYLGGLAIYVGLLTSLAVIFSFENHFFLILVGSTLLLFVGLIDDLIALTPQQKFIAQIVSVFCFLKSGLYLKTHFFSNIWSIFISALWCLTIINAFNLVDVMDGLSATLAALITSSFFAIALYYGHLSLALLLIVFLGTLLAFLCFNRPPASIYLGDAGSLFLGGFLAPIPFLFNWGTYNWYGYISPIVLFGIPLLEVMSLVLIRTYKGVPFYNPSPDHFCLYLKEHGWQPKHILGYMVLLSAIQLIVTFLFLAGTINLFGLIMASIAFISLWAAVLVCGWLKKAYILRENEVVE